MDDDQTQAALATVCRYIFEECRDNVLVKLRKQRRAANQRAFVAKRKAEQLQLEVSFMRLLNRLLCFQLQTIRERVDLALQARSIAAG